MVHIYYTSFDIKWSQSTLDEKLVLFSMDERLKILKYVRWEDRQSCILGKLLLSYGLKKLGTSKNISDVLISKTGKPYIANGSYFNISHSGKYVVCIISEYTEVGIDIEEIRETNIEDFHSVFTENEWLLIKRRKDQLSQFYELWTKKEAVIKADGRGLGIPLTKVESLLETTLVDHKEWFLQPVFIDNLYKCNFAASEKCEFILERVNHL